MCEESDNYASTASSSRRVFWIVHLNSQRPTYRCGFMFCRVSSLMPNSTETYPTAVIFSLYLHNANKPLIRLLRKWIRQWVDGEIPHSGNKSSNYSCMGEPYLQWWSDLHTCIQRVSPRDCLWLSSAAGHWGRAFKMAFTSSATAVSANSNWSWSQRKRQDGMEMWITDGWI